MLFIVVVAVRIEPHFRMGRRRRLLAEIVGEGLAVGGAMDKESAAANVARRGMGNG